MNNWTSDLENIFNLIYKIGFSFKSCHPLLYKFTSLWTDSIIKQNTITCLAFFADLGD